MIRTFGPQAEPPTALPPHPWVNGEIGLAWMPACAGMTAILAQSLMTQVFTFREQICSPDSTALHLGYFFGASSPGFEERHWVLAPIFYRPG